MTSTEDPVVSMFVIGAECILFFFYDYINCNDYVFVGIVRLFYSVVSLFGYFSLAR